MYSPTISLEQKCIGQHFKAYIQKIRRKGKYSGRKRNLNEPFGLFDRGDVLSFIVMLSKRSLPEGFGGCLLADAIMSMHCR
jgi:hypothetical protein